MKLENMFELAYCVNLKERFDRWSLCQEEFDKIHFFPERFDAIKHETPWMGCYLSHLEILKKARQENKNVIIFEDDVEFVNIQDNVIEKALDELYNLDYAMLYLGGNILKPFYQETDHLARLQHCQSTHSYAINKKYLDTIIQFLEKQPYIIDVLYANYVVPQLPSYIIYPMVAIQRTSYSNIEKQEMTYDIPIARYNQFFVKKEANNIG